MMLQVLMATTRLMEETGCPRGIDQLIEHEVKCTIINQSSKAKNNSQNSYHGIDIFNYTETGLSKSRNRNLNNITEEICLITDQDILFKQGFHNHIITAFQENPGADIIVFQIEDLDGKPLKKYKNVPFWMNHRDIMKVSSVEIAFRSSSILNNHIKFDERFGLGAIFPTGEEAIFLSDALKKNLKIKYLPIPIVQHPIESSGYNFEHNHTLITAKGAMLYRIFGPIAYPVSILFAFKKFKLSSLSFKKFMTIMLQGISTYKKL